MPTKPYSPFNKLKPAYPEGRRTLFFGIGNAKLTPALRGMSHGIYTNAPVFCAGPTSDCRPWISNISVANGGSGTPRAPSHSPPCRCSDRKAREKRRMLDQQLWNIFQQATRLAGREGVVLELASVPRRYEVPDLNRVCGLAVDYWDRDLLEFYSEPKYGRFWQVADVMT